ncbi:divergent PAP2 family protein, partial [candidate division WOR-3 bacterium]|nr:divergent PAP2 family protein [candidate division WOR-3 bacterium]
RAAGKQAEILNRIMEDIQYKRKVGEDRLIELLGHTPFEVLAGALIGMLVSIFFFR